MTSKDLQISELEKELAEARLKIEHLEKKCDKAETAEKKLFHEIYQYKELIHSSTALITLLLGPDFIIDFANDSIKKVWGKGDQVTGRPLLEVLPELKGAEIEQYLNFVYNTGEIYEAFEEPVEHVIEGKKVLYYFDFVYQPQYDLNGELIGIGVFAQDVTERAKMNKTIKKNEKEFRELIDLVPQKIGVAEGKGRTVFFNKAWMDYTGQEKLNLSKFDWVELIHPDQKEKVEDIIHNKLNDAKYFETELRFQNKKGDYNWHLCQVVPVIDDKGSVTSWISSSTEIQKMKEEEEKNEAFLRLVSHELKTPVTSIKGYIQLIQGILKRENEESSISPFLKRVEDQVERLILLISEMLDLARIEQNEMELSKTEFDLNKLVEEVVEDICYTNQEAMIQISHIDDLKVCADRQRIEQVIVNFLTNAIKYSPDDKHIGISIEKMDDNFAVVNVKDLGLGISKKDLQNIFRRFYRVEGKNQDTYSGFGIGLYLSNEIIERHRGKIFVKSKIGKGSEFTFTLPLNQQ